MLNTNILLLFILMLWSCNSDSNLSSDSEQFLGRYEIITYKSDITVDLNNDNIASNELINEINSFGLNDLEITDNLVSFFFPKTWITFQYPDSPEGSVDFLDYGFGTTYQYIDNMFSLKDDTYIEESFIDNIASNREVSINSDLTVIDDNHLQLVISKEYYDFNSHDWIMLNIDITYEKQ